MDALTAAFAWLKANLHVKTGVASFGAGFLSAKFSLFSLIVGLFG